MEKAAPFQTSRRPNPTEPPPRPRLFVFLSLSLNVALLVFLAFAWRKPAAVPANQTQETPTQAETNAKHVPARSQHVSSWSQLESTDVAIYASNLRTAGCPEKTVRDILLPLLEKDFSVATLPDSAPTKFWASFGDRQAAAKTRAAQESALRQEKDKAVKELFGFAWDFEELKHAYAGEAAGALGFLDYDRAEKLLCIADRLTRQFSLEENARRIDRRAAIYQDWRKAAGEVLSAADFEETEARALLLLYQRRIPTLCQSGLSGSELRQLMIYRRERCSPLPSVLLAEGRELVQEPDFAAEQQFNARARALLGDNRFIDLLKNCDATVARTLAALDNEHLPRSLALDIFDLRQKTAVHAQEIRQLQMHRAEKRVQLAALLQSAIDQIAALSNATTDSPVLRYNMDWLQDIKNP